MAYLALLQPDARLEARLRDALSSSHRVAVVPSWAALHRLVDAEPVDACVVDADAPSRKDALEEIRRLRKRHPWVALVAHATGRNNPVDLYQLGSLGVDDVVLAHRSLRSEEVASRVERSLISSRAARVRAALEGRYDESIVRAVGWAVEHGRGLPTVADFASALGQTPRGLAQSLRASGLPAPSRLLLWGRLLLAGAYLGREGRTVEETAFALGYSTANALARAMKRETGWTARHVAQRGGISFVQDQLFPRGRARRRRAQGAAVILVAALQSCASAAATAPSGPTLAGRVDAVLDSEPFDQVHFGVLAVDASSGRTLYEKDADKKFVPASNQKILVSAAALSLLGPEHRFETALWSAADVSAGTLHGDLILRGTGDPTLSSRYWESGEAALRALADSLIQAGVRLVAGELVVDVTTWDSATVAPTREVEDLRYGYGATGGAFAIDEGEIQVIMEGGPAVGSAPRVRWTPVGSPDFVRTRLRTVSADSATRVTATFLPESRRLVLEGHVAAGRTDTLAFASRDPVRQATATLTRILEERGVQLLRGARVEWDPNAISASCGSEAASSCPTLRRLAGIRSPPLAEAMSRMLGASQNWMSEQILRALGAERGVRGSWPEGTAVVTRFLVDEVGVDSLDFVVRDGSGLSAYNLVTPRAVVEVLRHVRSGLAGGSFRSALAEPGEKDSTLEDRLLELQGRLFAKTGSITNVNALSGFLVRADGGEVVFSILSNGAGLPSSRMREAIDEMVVLLAGS